MGSSGVRPRIKELSSFLVRNQDKVFICKNQSSRIVPVIVDAIFLLRDHEIALEAKDKFFALLEIRGNVGSHGAAVQKLNVHLDIKRPKDGRLRSFDLCSYAEERFLTVHILFGNDLDHIVFFDV